MTDKRGALDVGKGTSERGAKGGGGMVCGQVDNETSSEAARGTVQDRAQDCTRVNEPWLTSHGNFVIVLEAVP